MAYNSNIPQPSNKLRNSQGDLLANFQAIKTLIDVNHIDFADSTNQGKHNFVTLPVTTSSPSAPTFLSTEEGLYNLLFTTTNNNEIFAHIQQTLSGTRNQEIPFTASSLSRSAPVPAATNTAQSVGWTYLPSGMLLKWGLASGTGNVVVDTHVANQPDFTAILFGQATLTGVWTVSPTFTNASVIYYGPLQSGSIATQFNLYFANGSNSGVGTGKAVWLAIGY